MEYMDQQWEMGDLTLWFPEVSMEYMDQQWEMGDLTLGFP